MSLNDTPDASRIHIGLFGRRNVGKSSLINALTGQDVAIVSDIAGTTTDPVSKAMELLPLGPVVFVDTPGLDDNSELGEKRMQRSMQILEKIDIALIVSDDVSEKNTLRSTIESEMIKRKIPYLMVYNKSDIGDTFEAHENNICVSARTGENIDLLREKIAVLRPCDFEKRIVGDLLKPDDIVVMVIPVDKSAPKGRLILPQQQTIRDILDSNAQVIVTKEDAYAKTLDSLTSPPKIVITDSQVFDRVAKQTDEHISLTSFSILMARYKGILWPSVEGVNALSSIGNGDTILISEGCTHHRQCEDIGTVKLPHWISEYTNKTVKYEFTSGGDFPKDVGSYSLIVHCGGCMLQDKVMQQRLATAREQGVPITNYGILIAYINDILLRSIAPFRNSR